MAAAFTRIISDVHFGDRASHVKRLAQLAPLFADPAAVVINGDTLDTRPSKTPEITAATRAEVSAFFPKLGPSITFLTGNHDADYSPHHLLELAGGKIFITHGDILYDEMVPWSRDALFLQRRMAEEFATLTIEEGQHLETRLAAFRRVAMSLPQRHHSERNLLKYAVQFANDTVWPPNRVFKILRAWREMPGRAAELVRRHRPAAKFIVIGHTHRPGIWRQPDGLVVINTGSFTAPLGGCTVDVFPDRLVVRRIRAQGGTFRADRTIAEFALAQV